MSRGRGGVEEMYRRKGAKVTEVGIVMVVACGAQQWGCMGCDGGDTWGAMVEALSRIITASILHFKEHTTYCLRLLTATGA